MVAIMKIIFLAATCLAFTCLVNAERGYLLTVPKVLDSGTSERLCLTLTDVKGPGTVTIRLLQDRIDTAIAEKSITYPRDDSCFFLEIPNVKTRNARIEIKGDFQSARYSFESETAVSITSRSTLALIQTDKAIYKPGQKVQFRILTVNHLLEPISTEISKVYINNPTGVRIAQWLGVKNENGLIQLDMQLSDEPTLGKWKIYVQLQGASKVQEFEVDEYVLPKFEVSVTPPKYLLANSETATWKICARYTYGKDVQGTLTAEMNFSGYAWERRGPPLLSLAAKKINGCYDWIVHVRDAKWNMSSVSHKSIIVKADVKESGTDIEFSSSSTTSIGHDALKINMTPKNGEVYFRPGLPYFGELNAKKPDGQPASDVLILICYSVSNTKECRNYTSDTNGIVKFSIPPQKPEVLSISVDATAPHYKPEYYDNNKYRSKVRQPHSSKTLRPWFSPSGSFMDVKPVHKVISCDEEVPMDVLYTTNGEDITLNYQVMSRGRIVDYGTKSYKFSVNDYKEDSDVIRSKTKVSSRTKRTIIAPPDTDKTPKYRLPRHIGKFSLQIKIKAEMAPIARVLVYYIRPDGEVIAAFATLDVMPCFLNKAALTFEKKSIKPGMSAKYKIAATAKSLCAVGVVDKSTHLLKTSNQITGDKIFKILKGFDSNRNTQPRFITTEYCQDKPIEPRPTFNPLPPFPVWPRRSKRRSEPFWRPRSTTEYVDASMAFEASGLTLLTTNDVNTRPCRRHVYYPGLMSEEMIAVRKVSFSAIRRKSGLGRRPTRRPTPRPTPRPAPPISESSSTSSDDDDAVNEAVEVRTYFPETWLWDLEVVGDDGYSNKEAEIPHTITEWVGSMFCTSKSKGLGISAPSAIRAFQPFFVSYSLPYSVIRNEKVPITVSVFNYLSECLPIKLKLEKNDGFTLLSNSYTHSLCVCGGKPATHNFRILPTSLGEVNLTVHSFSFDDKNYEVCSQDKVTSKVVARDAITKPLLVEPEGFPQVITESLLFCPSEHGNRFKKDFELPLPDDLVEGSARAFLYVSGDIMGPSLSGLENLVTRPTGCGEQNMIKFAPIIFVTQYLQGVGSLTSETKKKSLEFMKIGYQRELTYRHNDGSYSAFGQRDAEGSSWLTAFVVKSFAQARDLIDIDAVDLKKSADWLLSKQQSDGCFPFIGMIHHSDMKGGVGKSVPTALTAYTVISILESETPISQQKLNKAFECISQQTDPNSYTLALSAYAYALAGRSDMSNKLIDKLYSRAIIEGTDVHWKAASKSISVELGSYVILTLMKLGGTANQGKALGIVRWIARQRNSNGGFVSTQDTVIALQAFAKVAVILNRNKQDLKVTAEGNGFYKEYAVNSTNRLLMQMHKIEELPNIVDVFATGDGCGLIQTTLKYNKKNVNASDVFDLTVVGNRDRRHCKKRELRICTRYLISNERSNMAIITVKMVSGYIPIKDNLKQLKDDRALNLKRYEVDANYVNLYFDYLSNDPTCFKMNVEKEIDVEDAKPATITVSDYYTPENMLEKSYTLPADRC